MDTTKTLWAMSSGNAGTVTPLACGRFEKELLRVGRWVHPARKFVLEVTRERMARWAQSFQRMLAKGIRVPVPYGHSYDARDNAGFVQEMFLRGDSLVGVFEIPREEDAARLGSVATDVSVSVNPDFVDGQGERFGEVIEHVAITNYPVVAGQANFVALGQDGAGELVTLEMEPGAPAGTDEFPEVDIPESAAGWEEDEHVSLQRRIDELEEERVDREVESLVLSGRIAPAVEGSVRRLLSLGGRFQLASTGESVSPADELRAILSALPHGAWVPLSEKAARARTLERRESEVSDERASALARENARLLWKGGAAEGEIR